MQRADKHEFVKDLNSVLKTEFVMVAHYKGLTVSEISNYVFRSKLQTPISKLQKILLQKEQLKILILKLWISYLLVQHL